MRVTNSNTELPIAIRAYAMRNKTTALRYGKKNYKPLKPSNYALVLDTETTTDATQRLKFGYYQLRKDSELIEAGFFL